jgi:hypothetical protein
LDKKPNEKAIFDKTTNFMPQKSSEFAVIKVIDKCPVTLN